MLQRQQVNILLVLFSHIVLLCMLQRRQCQITDIAMKCIRTSWSFSHLIEEIKKINYEMGR